MAESQADNFTATLDVLASILPAHLLKPRVGSTLASSLRDKVEVPYSSLKGSGRALWRTQSSLAFGLIGRAKFHPYEGHALATVVYPIRVLARLGVKNLIITNAAGGLNPNLEVGSTQPSLRAPFSPDYPRFLPLSDAYSVNLRRLAFLAAHSLSFPDSALQEGRFLRNAGADVVGMSTIPEVVAAREEGLEVTVLSLVTNKVVIPDKLRSIKEEVKAELAGKPLPIPPTQVVSHEEVLTIGRQKAEDMKKLVARMIELLQKQ
ncbi:nucleoside phosphorylase domain-containing protein [Irpex lacteus]|nr:nucleoside phosphorylase domain-containing protein [Irpex lacteus]